MVFDLERTHVGRPGSSAVAASGLSALGIFLYLRLRRRRATWPCFIGRCVIGGGAPGAASEGACRGNTRANTGPNSADPCLGRAASEDKRDQPRYRNGQRLAAPPHNPKSMVHTVYSKGNRVWAICRVLRTRACGANERSSGANASASGPNERSSGPNESASRANERSPGPNESASEANERSSEANESASRANESASRANERSLRRGARGPGAGARPSERRAHPHSRSTRYDATQADMPPPLAHSPALNRPPSENTAKKTTAPIPAPEEPAKRCSAPRTGKQPAGVAGRFWSCVSDGDPSGLNQHGRPSVPRSVAEQSIKLPACAATHSTRITRNWDLKHHTNRSWSISGIRR